ncbi:MAG: hypothetical protein II326_03735, partial [Clostridia bacterium]|nr:hypothetical protein [Clostridia bacterium]
MKQFQPIDRRSRRVLCRVCLLLLSLLLTLGALSSCAGNRYYLQIIEQQQERIEELEGLNQQLQAQQGAYDKLELIAAIFEQFGYYSGTHTQQEMLDAILKAYAYATGDYYAEYYTQEEYEQITAESSGDYEGIGVSVVQTSVSIDGYSHSVFQV